MIKRLILMAGLGLATATLGTACSSAYIDSERDSTIRIVKDATFAWGATNPSKPDGNFGDYDNPQMRGRLESAIDNFLLNKGLKHATAEQADYILSYHIGFKGGLDKEARQAAAGALPSVNCSTSRCWNTMTWGKYGSPGNSSEEYTYREGALIIDLRQNNTGILAWRGIYMDTLGDASKVTNARLAEVVAKVMKDAVR